jgi:hypothetical protein
LSSILPWFAFQGGESQIGFDVPVQFLFDPLQGGSGDGLKIGLLVFLIGIAGGALTFTTRGPGIRRMLASAAIAIGGIYIAQLARVVEQFGGGISVTDIIGFGVYVMLGGAALMIAGK